MWYFCSSAGCAVNGSLHSCWWEHEWFLALCELWKLFNLELSGNCTFPTAVLCTTSWNFILCTDCYSVKDFKVFLCRCLELFLCLALLSPILSQHILVAHFFQSLISIFSIQDIFGPFLLSSYSGNCFWVEIQGSYKAHLTWFLFLRDHNPELPIVQYVKTTVLYISSNWLVLCQKASQIEFPS